MARPAEYGKRSCKTSLCRQASPPGHDDAYIAIVEIAMTWLLHLQDFPAQAGMHNLL